MVVHQWDSVCFVHSFRKLAKSTLVLIPLYGVHYVVFIWIEPDHASDEMEVIWLYFEMTFNSFQVRKIVTFFIKANNQIPTGSRSQMDFIPWLLSISSHVTLQASMYDRFGCFMDCHYYCPNIEMLQMCIICTRCHKSVILKPLNRLIISFGCLMHIHIWMLL